MANFVASVTLGFKDAFSAGLGAARSNFTAAKDSFGAAGNNMAKTFEEMGKNNALLDVSAKLSMTAGQFNQYSASMASAVAGPSDLAKGLDSSFKNIQSVTGATRSEMDALQKELIAVGGVSTAGLQATADTYYDIAGGVSDASVRMPTLQAAMAMAEAGQADLGASTKGLISVMNSYGFSADKATFAADVYTRTVGMGVGSMDEFVSAMSPMAGLAASVKMPFSELGSAMAFMTTQGTSAAQSSTQVRAAITSMMNPNKDMTAALNKLGYASGTAMIEQFGLVGTLERVKGALGGSSDKMAQALGSTEALQAATALTKEGFADFAKTFDDGTKGITASAREIQLESFENKMAKLESAQSVFQAKMGTSANTIKGFFADVQTSVLTTFNSIPGPVGDAMASVASTTMMAGSSLFGMAGGALNGAASLATMTMMAKNAGGVASLFKDTMGMLGGTMKLLGAPFAAVGRMFITMGAGIIGALPALGTWIAGVWAAAAAHIAAAWPVYAIIAGVAALAAIVFLVVKNWGAVSAFFVGLWNGIVDIFKKAFAFIWGLLDNKWLQAALIIFMPFVGIPIAIIKNWGAIKGFFVSLWGGLVKVWQALPDFFSGIWKKATGFFKQAFDFVWGLFDNKILQAALAIFMPIVGIPVMIVKNWETIKGFFTSLWQGIGDVTALAWKGITDTVMGAWNAIKEPFTKVGDFFGGAGNAIATFFGGGDQAGQKVMQTMATGVQTGTPALTGAMNNAFTKVDRGLPHSDAKEGPLSQLTQSGRRLISTIAEGVDAEPALVDSLSQGLAPIPAMLQQAPAQAAGKTQGATGGAAAHGGMSVTIQKLEVRAEEFKTAMDFVQMLMQVAGASA